VTDPRTVPLQLAEQSARVMALNEKIEGLLRVIAERDELLIKKEQEAAENVQRLQAGWERERTELREKIAEREAEILRLNDKLLAEIKEVKSGESETWRQMGRMEALNDQLKEEIARLKAESGG
jgi:chromosome segregation ATPase